MILKKLSSWILAAAILLTATCFGPAVEGCAASVPAPQGIADSDSSVRLVGADVSAWNEILDWAVVSEQLDFAMLQVAMGIRLDDAFYDNAAGCSENGMPYGVYHYFTATTIEDARGQAQLVIDALEGLEPQLGVYLYIETDLPEMLTAQELQGVVHAFCRMISEAGYKPGLCSYVSLLEEYFTDSYSQSLPKWVIQPDENSCTYTGSVTMWQYSWSGRVAGISGDVALNYFYGVLPGNGQECDHEDCQYVFADNIHVVTCLSCGTQTSVPGTEDLPFRLKSVSLELASDITVLYKAIVPAGFTNAYVEFEVEGVTQRVTDYSVEESTGRYVFRYKGINPQQMGDNINATLYATLDGMEVSWNSPRYSVRTYVQNKLADDSSSKELKTLCSDLLVYGSMVQLRKGYKVDALVTEDLELTPSVFPGVDKIVNGLSITNTERENELHDVKSASLILSNQVSICFGFVLDDPQLYTYQVEMKGNVFIYEASDLTYDEAQGRYYLEFSEFNASGFDAVATVVILQDGIPVSRSISYSVNTYVRNKGENTDAIGNVLRALYNYGRSAAAYRASN